MERVIKFRGKRVDNSEWVYGDLIQSFCENKAYIDINHCFDIKHILVNPPIEVNIDTVGQLTGLVIGNKEIYEGDILTDEFRIDLYVIVFEEGSFRAYCKERNYLKNLYMDIEDVHLHLYKVGNIHDNPELLEVK